MVKGDAFQVYKIFVDLDFLGDPDTVGVSGPKGPEAAAGQPGLPGGCYCREEVGRGDLELEGVSPCPVCFLEHFLALGIAV